MVVNMIYDMVDGSNIAEVQYLPHSYSFVVVKLKKILLNHDYNSEGLKVVFPRHFHFSLESIYREFS